MCRSIPAKAPSVNAVSGSKVVGVGITTLDEGEKGLIGTNAGGIKACIRGRPDADAIRSSIDSAEESTTWIVIDVGDIACTPRIQWNDCVYLISACVAGSRPALRIASASANHPATGSAFTGGLSIVTIATESRRSVRITACSQVSRAG